MSWAEDQLRETFRQSLDSPGVVDPIGPQGAVDEIHCPSSERVWDAVNLTLNPADRREIVDHTSFCARCALTWQAALSVSREASELSEVSLTQARPITQARPNATPGWWQNLWRPRYLGPALGGMAAVLLALVWAPNPSNLEALPSAQPSGVLRGAATPLPQLAKHADQLGPGAILEWSSVADADGYQLNIMGPDGRIFSRVVEQSSYALDNSLLEMFNAGQQLFWSVQVVGGGNSAAASAEQSFTLGGLSELSTDTKNQ